LERNVVRLALAPVAILAGGLFMASNVSASVVGTLGTGTSGTVTVSLSSAFFNLDPAATGGGNSDVTNGTSLGFAGCVYTGSPNTGTAGCLAAQEGITVNNADLTLVAPSGPNANTFLTFAAHPNLVFSINWPPGPGSPNTNCSLANTNGASCSVFAGSPIILTYENGDTVAGLGVVGKASDTGVLGLATGSSYTGGFTEFLTQLLPDGMAPTPLNIQDYFCTGPVVSGANTCQASDFSSGKSISVPDVGGSFTATVLPEPDTLAYMLIGGVLIGLNRIRRRT